MVELEDFEMTDQMPEPTYHGKHGRAWEMDIDAIAKAKGVGPADNAMLSSLIVEAPWAHPVWHDYIVVLVHLREMPDGRGTKIYLDGATHEFWIYALDPSKPLSETYSGSAFHVLTPMNFAAQRLHPGDAAALGEVADLVRKIADGEINPDTDNRRGLAAIYGDAMIKAQFR